MTLSQVLNAISVGLALILGIVPIIFPHVTARLLHFDLPDGRGVAEVRIGIGGLVAGIAIATLIGRDPAMKNVIAGAWYRAVVNPPVVDCSGSAKAHPLISSD